MFFVSHSMFSVTHNMSKRKTVPVHQLLGFSHGLMFFPQQPERLGVLPIKLRGGLGQPPETLHQFREVPKEWNRFRSEGSIHETLGSERFRSEGSIHETLGSERFRSEGSIHETLGSERFRSEGSIHETLVPRGSEVKVPFMKR